MLRAPAAVAAGVVVALIGGLALGAPAASADELGSGVLNLSKVAGTATVKPGQQFVYTLNFGCSSTTTGCVDATLTDPIPAPLVVVGTPTVVGAGSVTTTVTGNTLKVVFKDSVPNTTPASTGLAAGTTGSVQFQVKLPDDAAKSYDGTVLTNTATFTAANAATVAASAPVTVQIPDVIAATVTKTWAPLSTQFQPGEESTATLGVRNGSNIDASSLAIDEPADPAAAGSTFNFYDLSGFGDVVFPEGADQVQVVATAGGAPIAGPVGTTPVLPTGVDPGTVTALRFVFSSSTGATIVTGGTAGSVELTLTQRAANRATSAILVVGGTRVNTIAGAVSTPNGDAPAQPVSASQVIAPLTVSVAADKSFATQQLPAGQSTTAKLTARNTSTGALTSLTIREPGTGTFFTNDVSFGGFAAGSAWPDGATGATVKWFVSGGTAPADSSFAEGDALPSAPAVDAGQYLTGFEITYTGRISTGATAIVPFTVATTTAAGPAGAGFTRYPNEAMVTGVNAAGTATDPASADLDVYFPEVKLTLDKTITPQTVIPGGTSLVQLQAQTPSGTSSVRPASIVITEPQSTATAPYWNAFDAAAVAPTSVPKGSTLTVRYTTDGTTWKTLETVDATTAAKTYSRVLDDVLPSGTSHSDVVGLQFAFADASGFGQATAVKPGIVFVARGELRDGSGVTNPGTYPTLTPYDNCASAQASGTINGGTPIDSAVAVDCASANVQATDGGPGPLIASKAWDGTKVLQAQSKTTTGVTLGWGTQTSGITSMTIQDPAAESPLSGSVFQAFDLVRIDAITPTSTAGATYDPLIRWDAVSKVELFDGASWVDITSKACATAQACRGTFPGYTLSTAERASTQGVRLTVIERPDRADAIAASGDATAPFVGSGVASASAGAFPGANPDARTMHLDLQLRNAVRNSAIDDWVTGARTYNMAGSPGAVDNTVKVTGQPASGAPFTRTAADHVTIIDPMFTTKVTKSASATSLVIPQPDVPGTAYPTTTYTTTIENTSTTNTWQLRLSDPVQCTNAAANAPCVFGPYVAASNPFETLNLTAIKIDLTNAAGVQPSLSQVSLLHRAADGTLSTENVSLAAAAAKSATDLSDVVGVSVLLRGTNAQGADGSGGSIAPGQKATVTFATQLRDTARTTGVTPIPSTVPNTAFGTLHDEVYPTADAGDSDSANVALVSGNIAVTARKSITPTSTLQANPVSPITVLLGARSTGTISPKVLVVEDSKATFWNAFTLGSFSIPTAPTGANRVLVEAQTGQGAGATWHGTSGTPTTLAAAALPSDVTAADVTGLRFTFSRADGASFAASNNVDNIQLKVSLRSTLRDGSGPVTSTIVAAPMPGETAAGTVTDTVFADAAYNAIHATRATATATFTVTPGTATIAVEKTSPGQAAAGREVPWTLRFKNTGTGYLPNPVVTDTLPSDGTLLFVPTNVPVYATSIGGTLPTDGATITRTYDPAAGTIRFVWPAGSRLAPGETYSITLTLQIKPGANPGTTALNTFGVTSDRTFAGCTALNAGNGRPVSLASNTCSTNNVVTTLAQGSFTASKGVSSTTGKAQNIANPAVPCTSDGDGFYRYPCAAVSAIGATDTWKLEIVNGGNVAARNLVAIDVFPHPGDVGVVDPSQRGSVFSPRFNADLAFTPSAEAAGSSMAWFVSTAVNPCVTELTPGGAACPAGSWIPSSAVGDTIDAGDVTGVKLAFDFSRASGGTLAPGAVLKVTYSSTNVPTTTAGDDRAPVSAPVTGVRAWNSFGFYPTYVSGSQPAGPQEPIKSGVILTGGSLRITKAITGPGAAYAPTSFVADVACTVDGAMVDLGAASSVTLSDANGYAARVDGIPVGSVCRVTEHGAEGSYGESTRTVTPASVTIRTSGSSTDAVPADQSVAIVNDYAVTALTVTKKVDTAATAGTFGPFDFTLSCVAAGGQAIPLPAGDAAFSLADGGSHTIGDLPVRARCELTETGSDGAATAPNHVAISVNGAAETTGPQATITIANAAGGNTALVTNHYAAGTLSIAKTVDGDAAGDFGGGPFTAHITCVYGTQTLFDGDLSIVGGETEAVPQTFPAGTSCAIAETKTGGATSTTIDTPTVVIPGNTDGTVAAVTVNLTNTFSAGSVTIEKVRTGDGVATYGSGPFTAQLVCTWQKDGQQFTIPLPGGGVVTLDAANGYTATVTGLIQGAHCDVTETATGGATSVVVAPASGVTVPAGTPATVTITNTFGTGSLAIVKKRIGDGVEKFGAGPFTVTVDCTYVVDGVVTPIELGANGTISLSKDNGYTATVPNLIAGARCAIVETDAGLATATTMDPADGVVTIGAGATATVTVTNTFDVGHLTIRKDAARDSVSLGDTIVYTITVTNDGRIDAHDVKVTDTMPAPLRLVSTAPTAAVSGRMLTWTIGALAVGASTTFTVEAVLTSPADTTNRVTVENPPGPWTPPTSLTPCADDPTAACATVVDPPRAGGSGLASTGSDVSGFALLAGLALLAGAALLVANRLRRLRRPGRLGGRS